MSKENVKKFFAEIEKKSELKAKYLECMNAYHKESDKMLAEKLIEIGLTAGFSFNDNDLNAVRAELTDQDNSNDELDNSDLAKASGGVNINRAKFADIRPFIRKPQ